MSPKITTSVIAILTCGAAAFALPQPLIHYQFNDSNTNTTTATDSSGNNRNGTIYNYNGTVMAPAALQNAVGVSGRAGDYAFNNTGSAGMGGFGNRGGAVNWKATSGNAIGNLTSMTMSFWVKTEAGVSSGNSARIANLYGSNYTNYVEVRALNNGVIQSAVNGSIRTTPENTIDTENQWVFFAITFDASAAAAERIKFYMGGVEDEVRLVSTGESSLASIVLGGAGQSLTLGSFFNADNGLFTGQTPFDGFIDDYRLYGATSGSAGALSLADLDLVRLEATQIPEPGSVGLIGGIAISLLLAGQHLKRRKA